MMTQRKNSLPQCSICHNQENDYIVCIVCTMVLCYLCFNESVKHRKQPDGIGISDMDSICDFCFNKRQKIINNTN